MKANITIDGSEITISSITSEGGWLIEEKKDGSGLFVLYEHHEGTKPAVIDEGYLHDLVIVASTLI